MCRNNFAVRVLEKRGAHLKLELTIIRSGQEEFYCAKNVGLQLIYNIDSRRHEAKLLASALGTQVTPERIVDRPWLLANAPRFIEDIQIDEKTSFPDDVYLDELSEDELEDLWKDRSKLPKAIYSIRVTDPRWIEHLRTGQRWDAGVYDFTLR